MSYYRHGPHRPSGVGISVPGLTPCVKVLIIACVGVWLIQTLADRQLALSAWLGLRPSWVAGQGPGGIPFVWQLVTYMFLHEPSAIFHILFNMLLLWMFGSELETYWGRRPFLTYYLVCGVGAGVLATLLGLLVGKPDSITIGASGAIYGLMIAFGTVFANRTILFMMIFPMRARTFAWILFAIAFFSTFNARGDSVSHVAHLGGALTGWLYLKRAWRVGAFYRELRWRIRRRRFKVMPPQDPGDRWLN
jgi:membrane associated rhomboid family serine protease